MNINRIVIRGASGYCLADEAYEDKLTITKESISYEYKPHPQSNSQVNIHRKWSYKTTSPVFRDLYRRAADMTPAYLHNDEILFVTDIGPIEIIATFEDGHKENVNYFCPSEFFKEWFLIIKQMVPGCECVPAVLLTSEDFEGKE